MFNIALMFCDYFNNIMLAIILCVPLMTAKKTMKKMHTAGVEPRIYGLPDQHSAAAPPLLLRILPKKIQDIFGIISSMNV